MRRLMPIEERFRKFVRVSDGCHEWTSVIRHDGYGSFWVSGRGKQMAHRVAYEIAHGPIPEGRLVLHRCDNRKCVNPVHLYLGSQKDNGRDMDERGRRVGRRKLKTACVSEIVRLINERVLSQEKIARRFGVSQITVSRIKLGQRQYLRELDSRKEI